MLNKYAKLMVSLTVMLAATTTQSFAMDKMAVSKGAEVYKHRCMHCHGDNADGKGFLVDHLKIKPADLSMLNKNRSKDCITGLVLQAVLGRHTPGGENNMPLLKEYMTPEQVYFVSEYIKSIQK